MASSAADIWALPPSTAAGSPLLPSAKRPLIALLGPTACGKTALALELAERFGFEIVNCDSRQIYREMEIGTAKPTPAERQRVPHHLLDLISPNETFSAGAWASHALPLLTSLWQQGRRPLLVGGTGFYYDALVHGLPSQPSIPDLRCDLERRLANEGLASLVAELHRQDPVGAATLDQANPRRVIRALELVLASGKPLAEVRANRRPLEASILPFVVSLPRDELHRRIAHRVENMLTAGLAEEVRALATRYSWTAPGLASIGYAEWRNAGGDSPHPPETIDAIIIHTRQYARRQLTFFRRRPGGDPLDLSQPETHTRIQERIANHLRLQHP